MSVSGRHAQTLIDALQNASRYPHPVDRVELKETPLSWVLLAGEFAYKIKKPVKVPFADFSTLERRRRNCLDEVRLNRRFAPDLYLDVIALGGTPDSPTFDGGAAPIEYAVKLRRFAERDELWSLLERGEVRTQELQAFGERLARLHEESPVCERGPRADRAFATLTANLRELEALGREQSCDIEPFKTWTEQEWARVGALAGERCAQGKVRDCHGDLHAGNVVRLDGQLVAFDCIEFNEELRCIDVMNDAAFLVMDLIARECRAHAYAFLNGWLESGGEYEGVPLLRLFCVYRALVRAKVALLGNDPNKARRYFETADSLTRVRKPVLAITCGLSGSGKTWLSSQLMTALGWLRVRSDVERKRLAGLRPEQSSRTLVGHDIYTREFNERVYSRLRALARTMLEAGHSVIVDAAFLRREERSSLLALAEELAVPGRIVHCVAPIDQLRERLERRQRAANDASEADASVMEKQRDYWEPLTAEERTRALEIRTDEPRSAEAALYWLQQAETVATHEGTGRPAARRSP
ncbi:MAG TPA: AAA family ATPase [Steroidobacter sp.]